MTNKIIEAAKVVGADWTEAPYYDDAEKAIETQWQRLIWPIIHDADFSSVLDLAAGHGRNTSKLLEVSKFVVAADINQSNIDALNSRFSGHPRLRTLRNTGADLREINGGSFSLVYCFDAMVHFDSDVVRSYINEFRRVLKPGGRGFCHYSAADQNPAGSYRDHPGWRNFMSRALFEHWLAKSGFAVIQSQYVAGNIRITDDPKDADCITYFELPPSAQTGPVFENAEERASELERRLSDLTSSLDEIRRSRDEWKQQAERLAVSPSRSKHRSWWRRLIV